MKLTESTLKMARISGLDYAESTDYMTNALRSFKMQMQDAERIVNVYSSVAASSATNVEELAQAMSKTASSAEAVGASFENTTAMMAVMIEATRQAPENIGSAMKSIISRYGQLKTNPQTLVDAEGQELSLNKVDTALQSVGISIHNAQGQFRNFDEVILELAESWDTIDVNTQRYIATIMAGNRQQSRFLALVSSGARLKELMAEAADSENTAQLQYLKTLDSVEAKQQQMKTSMQSLYLDAGIQDLYKGMLDLGTQLITTFLEIPRIGKLPIPAIVKLGTTFANVSKLVTAGFTATLQKIQGMLKANDAVLEAEKKRSLAQIGSDERKAAEEELAIARNTLQQKKNLFKQQTAAFKEQKEKQGFISAAKNFVGRNKQNIGMGVIAAGTGLTMLGAGMGDGGWKTGITAAGGALSGIGSIMLGGPMGKIMGTIQLITTAVELLGNIIETTEEKLERLDKAIEDTNNNKLKTGDQFKTLIDYKNRLTQLSEEMKTNSDAKQEWIELNAEIANKYPELINHIDQQGNLIVSLTENYDALAEAKKQAYADAIIESGKAQLKAASDNDWIFNQLGTDALSINKMYNTLLSGLASNPFTQLKNLNTTVLTAIASNFLDTIGLGPDGDPTNLQLIASKLNINESDFKLDPWSQVQRAMQRWIANQDNNSKTVAEMYKYFEDVAVADKENENVNVVEYMKNINQYRTNFINGIITSSIAALRQSYDAILDKNNEVTGLAGLYMNKQLKTSYDTYKENTEETDEYKIWENWSKGQNLKTEKGQKGALSSYQEALFVIQETQKQEFRRLNQHYKNIGNLTREEFQNIIGDTVEQGNYTSEAAQTFADEYKRIEEEANAALFSAGFDEQAFSDFSANLRKRIAAVTSNNKLNVNDIVDKLDVGKTEQQLFNIVTILESNTLDTIIGIEDTLKQYAETSGIERGTDQWKADSFVQLLEALQHSVKINFNTEYQTLVDGYNAHLKELDKALKNATSGMDNQDATKLANQLNTTLSDSNFKFIDGKWFFQDLSQIYSAFMPNDNLLNVINNYADEAKKFIEVQEFDDSNKQYQQAIEAFRKAREENENLTWDQWIDSMRGNIQALVNAGEEMTSSYWLTSGNIQQFLKSIKDESVKGLNESNLYAAALNGQLTGDLAKFQKQIIQYYEKGATAVYDSSIKILNGQVSSAQIEVTAGNKQLIRKIKGNNAIQDWEQGNKIINLTQEDINNHFSEIMQEAITQQGVGWKARIDNAAKIWNARFANNNYDSVKSALDSFESMDYSVWQMLPEAFQKIAILNQKTGKFALDINNITDDMITSLDLTLEQANQLKAKVAENKNKKSATTIITKIVKNNEKLSEENIAELAILLQKDYDEIIKQLNLISNGDGSYKIDLTSLRQLINDNNVKLTKDIQQSISKIISDAIETARNITKTQFSGTTNYSQLQQIVQKWQQSGYTDSFDDLFEWDNNLHAYVATTQGLFAQLVIAQEKLQGATEEERKIAQTLIDDLGRQFLEKIDLSAVISAVSKTDIDNKTFNQLQKALNDYNQYMLATGQTPVEFVTQINEILEGGFEGVQAAKTLASITGKELSKSDIDTIYKKRATALVAAMNEVNSKAGTIVGDQAAKIIKATGGQISKLRDGSNVVIKSATDMTAAYFAVYNALKQSGTATIEELNNVVAKAYEAYDKAELTSMMSGLTDLTYSALANIFTAANDKMTPTLLNRLFESGIFTALGAGKVRINDFELFAHAMGIDPTSQDYYKAFSTYNDQMINLNKQTSNNIRNAAKNILDAKTGDQINLTELYTHLEKSARTKLVEQLETLGASLDKGILTINNSSNVHEIYQKIIQIGFAAGKLVKEDLVEVEKTLMKHQRENNLDAVVQNIASNADKITEEEIDKLAQALGIEFEKALKYFAQGDNGFFKIDQAHLRQAIGKKEINKTTSQAIANMISSQIEAAQNIINSIVNNVSNGFTNFSEVQKILDELNKNSAVEIKWRDIASYDFTLKKWVLNTQGIIYQMQMAEQQLKRSGMNIIQARRQLLSMRQQLADNIDIMSYIDSNDKDIAIVDLTRSIQNFNAASQAIGYTTGIAVDKLTTALYQGGMTAVNALSEFANITGQKLTSADYLKVYQIGKEKITTAMEEISTSVGGVISKETKEILQLNDTQVQEIAHTGKYLVQSTLDLVEGYNKLLEQMALDGNATLEQINDIIVNKYQAEFSKEKIISQISNGTLNMSSLKELANKMGYRLDSLINAMVSAGIAQVDKYAGNIKILDFDRFNRDVLGFDPLSQAYREAYKAFNASLIDRATKEANDIRSELDTLVNAKSGDSINISTIWSKIVGQKRQELVAEALLEAGVEVYNGILFITETAEKNIVSIIRGIAGETNIYLTKKGNELIAEAYKQQQASSLDNLYLEILKSHESLNEDNILAIANAFNLTYDSVKSWFDKGGALQGDGTYKITVNDVAELFKDRQISEKAIEQGKEIIGDILDGVIDGLSGISTKVFNLNQMSAFITDLKTKTGNEYNTNDLFNFNKELGGYVLTTKGIYTQFKIASLQTGKANVKAQKLLEEQAKALLENIDLVGTVERLQGNLHERVTIRQEIRAAIQKYNAAMTALGRPGLNPTVLLSNLAQGGQKAVRAAEVIAKAQGSRLSDDDATSIYRSRVQKLMQASDELLSATVGDIISDTAADLLGYSQTSAQRLTTSGSAVLQSAEKLVDAYEKLYNELVQSGAATLSELNQVMANLLSSKFESSNGSNKGLQYLEKATSLTYQEFGEMFAEAGVTLTQQMFEELKKSNIISEIGGGLLRVEDFNYIAQRLGLKQNSEEYTRAFKAYNDALIELDNQVTDNILDEINNIAEARAGRKSKVNLTQLVSKLNDETLLSLSETLADYGGWLSNGILTIHEKANIPALIQNIMSIAKEKGILLETELAELANTLAELIGQFASTIADAISGGLSNTDANILKNQAKNWFGIDLNFTKTYDGLKLSTDQANKLYQALKQIDSGAANKIFVELKDSLVKANQTLSSASGIAAQIKRLQEQLANSAKGTNKVLEERLALYKEIQVAQLDSAESYDFMGRALPEGMQGVENYWNSIGKAFKILNEASVNATKPLEEGEVRKDSTVAIQDYYNMINEFNNLAKLSGTTVNFLGMELAGDMQSAAAAIEKGYSALSNIDGQGAVINLTKLGIDFTGGAEGMAKGIDAGIKAMASSQIKMLDGLIQLLQTIVAMENFEGLDTNFDGTLGLKELFKELENGMQQVKPEAQTAAQAILQQATANQDLQKGLSQVAINGKSLLSMIQELANGTQLTTENAKTYTAAISSLYQQFKQGDYDLNNLANSILENARNSDQLIEIELDGKKFVIGRGIQFTRDEHGDIIGPDGQVLGKTPEQAYKKYEAQIDKTTINAIMTGASSEGEINLQDNHKLVISEGIALIRDETTGMYTVGNKQFQSPEQAKAQLDKETFADITKALNSATRFQIDGQEYITIAGRLIKKIDDSLWEDSQGRQYQNEEAFAKAMQLQVAQAWTGVLFDQFEDGGKVGIINFGIGIKAQIKDGEVKYSVGDHEPTGRINQAKEWAIADTVKKLQDANDDNLLLTAIETHLVTCLENDGYQFNGRQYNQNQQTQLYQDLKNILFPNGGKLDQSAVKSIISQTYTVQPQLLYDADQLKAIVNNLQQAEYAKLQKALASGNKNEIQAALGIQIDWKSSDPNNASIEQLQQLATDLGMQFDTKIMTLSATYDSDDTKTVIDIITQQEVPLTVKVTAQPADQASKKILEGIVDDNVQTTLNEQARTSADKSQQDGMKRTINELQKQINTANEQNIALTEQITKLQSQITTLNEQKVQLNNLLTSQDATIQEKEKAIQQWKDQLDSTEQIYSEKIANFEQQLAQASAHVANLQQSLAKQTQQNANLTESNDSLEATISSLKQQIALDEAQIISLKQQLEIATHNQPVVAQAAQTLNMVKENQELLGHGDAQTIEQAIATAIVQSNTNNEYDYEKAEQVLSDIRDWINELVQISKDNQSRSKLTTQAKALEQKNINSGLNNPIFSAQIDAFIQGMADSSKTIEQLNNEYEELNSRISQAIQQYEDQQKQQELIEKEQNDIKKAKQYIEGYKLDSESTKHLLSLFDDNDLKRIGQYISNNGILQPNSYGVSILDSKIKEYNQQVNNEQFWAEKGKEYTQLSTRANPYISGWNNNSQIFKTIMELNTALKDRDLDNFEIAKNELLLQLQKVTNSFNQQQGNQTQQQIATTVQEIKTNEQEIIENTKQPETPLVATQQTAPNTWNNINGEEINSSSIQMLKGWANEILMQNQNDDDLWNALSQLEDVFTTPFDQITEQVSTAFTALYNYLSTNYPDNSEANQAQVISTVSDNGGTEALAKDAEQLGQAASAASSQINAVSEALDGMPDTSETLTQTGNALEAVGSQASSADSSMGGLSNALSAARGAAQRAAQALSGIPSNIQINLVVSASAEGGNNAVKGTVNGYEFSNSQPLVVSLTGTAAAKGKTLVGELGPELVVSNGRYFLVGQAGAEMVSLPDDAIVFNHIQTKNLLKKERGGGRGKPITNERNAVAFAKGTGPAMASASAALATLKQIRAMWQSMLNASMRDLGSLAGQEAGKSSSKSGGGSGNDPEQVRAIVEEIERWYNLLRQINRLQQDITYQQTLQAEIESDRVANGQALYRSYKQEIQYLDQQIIRNQQLADLQKSWYERKRNELAASDYGKIFTYDENGQLQYRDGRNYGLDILEKLTERNIYGETTGAAKNASTQISYLRSIGFDTEKLKYNDDGTIIDASSDDYKDNPDQVYEDMMQNFWNNLDGWKDELDGIYDSYRDQLNNVLSNETKRNQLLQKIVDNQLSVEQDVLKAIESRQQKIIDELQDERNALEKSNKDFINGLTDQLNQQKQMYQNAENQKELVKLRRQIAILQRSGGSASQIRSLQQQVAAKEQEQYFSSQQQQIAAIQKASDLQIQRLDSQIDLMTETLKYQKQNGLLWEEVYQIMSSTPQQIRQFITENTPDFQSASALDVAEKIRDIDLRINEWIGYRDDDNAPAMTGDRYYDWDSYSAARTSIYGSRASDELKKQAKDQFDRTLNETGDINLAGEAADAIFRAVLGEMPKVIEKEQNSNNNNNNNNNNSVITKIQQYIAGNGSSNYSSYYNDDWSGPSTHAGLMKGGSSANTSSSNSKTTASSNQTFSFGSWQAAQDLENLSNQIETVSKSGAGSSVATESLKTAYRNMYNTYSSQGKLTDADKKKYNKYDSGGLVDYTGLAQVDGTPSRPEAFLNAQQTELLRNHLFGASNSLLALARNIVQQMHGTTYGSSTLNKEDNGVSIGHIDVNVNVKEIANDYDVRSIGNTVMDEMLKIARKSGTRGLSRR